MEYVVYDIECQYHPEQVDEGWDNPHGMAMSVGCAWWSKNNKFYYFGDGEDDRRSMCEFLNGKTCVTFNGVSFDSRVLLGNDRFIEDDGRTRNDKYCWANKDVYLAMWKKILNFPGSTPGLLIELSKANNISKNVFNLDSILWATLKSKKNSNGQEAVNYYQTGQLSKLYEYVLQDVRCERDLYKFVKRFGYLVTGSYDIVNFTK